MRRRLPAVAAGFGAAVVTGLWLANAGGPALNEAGLLVVVVTAAVVGGAVAEGVRVFVEEGS